MATDISLTGNEVFFDDDELIVSKTDLKGRITYCNEVFLRVAGYQEQEVMGQPHSIIRHPDMPRCIFKVLWDTIESGSEIFAYVVNRAKNGDHYWVWAHVTPSFDASGSIVGYHSNRRVPNRETIDRSVIPLYQSLLAAENTHDDRKVGMNSAVEMVHGLLQEKGMGYDEFIFSL